MTEFSERGYVTCPFCKGDVEVRVTWWTPDANIEVVE